jgi:hypothetical protein
MFHGKGLPLHRAAIFLNVPIKRLDYLRPTIPALMQTASESWGSPGAAMVCQPSSDEARQTVLPR